jgi:hypothetical protein
VCVGSGGGGPDGAGWCMTGRTECGSKGDCVCCAQSSALLAKRHAARTSGQPAGTSFCCCCCWWWCTGHSSAPQAGVLWSHTAHVSGGSHPGHHLLHLACCVLLLPTAAAVGPRSPAAPALHWRVPPPPEPLPGAWRCGGPVGRHASAVSAQCPPHAVLGLLKG